MTRVLSVNDDRQAAKIADLSGLPEEEITGFVLATYTTRETIRVTANTDSIAVAELLLRAGIESLEREE